MNKLEAKITAIKSTENLSLLSLSFGEETFSALIIRGNEDYVREGNRVYMVFKETEMSVAKGLAGALSIRNRFQATISAIKHGDLLSEVKLNYKGSFLTAIITNTSAMEMLLQVGDEVTGLVKTNELMVMKFQEAK